LLVVVPSSDTIDTADGRSGSEDGDVTHVSASREADSQQQYQRDMDGQMSLNDRPAAASLPRTDHPMTGVDRINTLKWNMNAFCARW
jgi:hypothetical protein